MIGPLKYFDARPNIKCFYSAQKFENKVITRLDCHDHVELYWNEERDIEVTKFNPIIEILVIEKDNHGRVSLFRRYYRYIL